MVTQSHLGVNVVCVRHIGPRLCTICDETVNSWSCDIIVRPDVDLTYIEVAPKKPASS